ncbi:MAG: ABC transporter substrate-binding protein [Caldilinea sp.]|jgi:peptide/nickel transport system substrate-binding protein|nr:ABC transporter substrate-binding protein [Caldilinea sp.]
MKRRLQNPTQALVADFQSGRISRRQFLQTLAMLSGGVALAACAPAAPAAPSAASSAGGITPQVMIYGGSQDIASIDPSDRTDYSINAVMRQMYDRLFRFEGGWPQPIEPGLAQEWSASEDAREWTFQITDQAKFHDGTPLTAEDVAYSYQRTLRAQKQRASLLMGYLDPENVVATDNTTVKMTLKTPYGNFDRLLAFLEQPIVSKKVAMDNDQGGDEGAAYLIDHEAGSGPFAQGNWQIGQVYELEAVPDYWQGWPGAGRLAKVVWRKTEDVATRKTGLLSGDFDMADTISVNDIEEINGTGSHTAEVNFGLLAGYLKMNTQEGPTADPNFRKFLAHSFNRQAFSDSQMGYVKLMTGPLPEGVPGYDPNLEPQYPYDPELAKAFLDQSAYKEGGIDIDFVYVSGLDFEEAAGLILLDELKKYNITLNLVPKNWPDIVGACSAPATGPHIGFIFDQFPPLADTWLVEKYWSGSWDRPTGGSFQACSFYRNADVDLLLDELRVTTDAARVAELVATLQAAIAGEAPDVPIYVSPNVVGYNKRVKGYNYFGDISVDFWRLWMEG